MQTKRNFSSLVSDSTYDVPYELMGTLALQNKKRKLRRLPHVFSKVLVLPLSTSDADVSTEEQPHCFRIVAKDDSFRGGLDVRAHIVEDHSGVTNLVVTNGGRDSTANAGDLLNLDMWRFRLPANTWPEVAKAVYGDGELVVTVPKRGGGRQRATSLYMDNLVEGL